MTVTNKLQVQEVKEELTIFLRNQDIFTIAQRGVITLTEEFSGDAATKTFTLSNTPARNVRSITVGGSSQTFGTDYTVNYSTAIVTFTSAPASGTDNVDITYDYGSPDKIFSDFPREDLHISSYPRISIDVTSSRTSEFGIGAGANITEMLVSIYTFAEGNVAVDDYTEKIREAILDNKSSFYYLKFLTPQSLGPLLDVPDRDRKIMMRVLECQAPYNVEIIS